MMAYFAILLAMTLMGAAASLFLKRAAGSEGLLSLLKNGNLYAGGLLYFISALLNIYLLRHMDYSAVLPLTSLTYVWTMLLSRAFLEEKITKKKVAGVLLILIGAACISVCP